MAVTSPAPDNSWPRDQTSQRASTAETGPGSSRPAEGEDGGSLDLNLIQAVIQDGVLMVLGPDGDPVPPQAFGAAAAAQPHGQVRLGDGPPVKADRIAAALDAQMRGRLGSGQGGDEAWIKSMLGIGPQPEPAGNDDLLAEGCEVEVIPLGRELMITSPSGGTFLIAEARSTTPAGIRLHGADGELMALSDLVARLPGHADRDDADKTRGSGDEVSLPGCRTWIEEDALIVDLPEIGPVYLVRSDPADQGPSVSVFMPDGDTATIDELLGALSRPLTAPDAGALACEEVEPTIAGPSSGGETSPDAGTLASDEVEPTIARPSTGGDPGPALGPSKPPSGSPRRIPLTIGLPNAFAARPDDVALVVIHGLPHGASLSAGIATGDGSWMVSPRDLAGLSVMPPPGLTLDFALEVVAITVQGRDGDLARASITTQVPLQAVPGGHARAPIPVRIDSQMLSRGEGPLDALVVRDLPAGARLSAGVYDPAIDGWVLLTRHAGDLTVTPGIGQSEDFTLTLLGINLSDGRARSRFLARIPVSIR